MNVDDIDLGRHAVIEASAGTGKTHTIELVVLRLLKEQAIPLEQILIVTFTEKATGELKARLRSALERSLQSDDEPRPLLKAALDHFDQASIFTIHGFCQRLLQEYALEQGQDFQAEHVEDPELLRTLLKEIQRKAWRSVFGTMLRAVLDHAGYNRDDAAKWESKVLDIANRYKPRSGHQLRPAAVQDWQRRLDEPDANWAGQLEVFTIETLHQQLRDFKRQRGLQSFDDMIAAVEENLDPEKNPDAESFLQVLRERYRYAIVDEFQDTDPLQWRIFRRIFLDAGESKLFIVGDPKQAIYGFRGSDLPTYLRAAKEIQELFNGEKHELEVNWRSDTDLLDALNGLFGDGDWFLNETGIGYVHVHAPDDDCRQTRAQDDRTNRPALTIVDLAHCDKIKTAQKHFARFVAFEIQRLLGAGEQQSLLSFSLKNRPARPIHAGDICVLVTKRADADPIIHALELAGVPYSFYKQTGLWQADEAIHLEVLLQTLARPDDRISFRKALLTCFFRVKPGELARTPDLLSQHPARRLYQTWLGYVANRQWSALFRSLLEDTGLLFASPNDAEADRRLVNLRQLLAALEQIGHGSNFDLQDLLEAIKERRQRRDASEIQMQPDELGRAKVKIMTIHACKGLEFPIVFLAGGFTQGQGGGNFASYRDEQERIVFDLLPDSAANERVAAERLSEQRRLLYVALTRAMFKLYVPQVKIPSRTGAWLGPVGTILLPALRQACPDKLGPLIADVIVPPLAVQVPARQDQGTPAPALKIPPFRLAGPLFPALDTNLGKRRIAIRSFSSMARHHLTQLGDGSSFGEQSPVAIDESATSIDRDDPLRGAVFGDMVHNVLEKIGFAEVARAAGADDLIRAGTHARKLIDQQINANITKLRARTPIEQLEQASRQLIAQLVWCALRTPLTEIGGPLCDLPAQDRRAEVEFIYPERPGLTAPADQRLEESFVTGFMDLLFRKDDRYYLLDWKTNMLAGYSREHLKRSMADSDYARQYRLYLQAVSRWLKRIHGPKFKFLDRFGGVYYLYVRGMNGRDDTQGVFFHRPTAQELDLDYVLKH